MGLAARLAWLPKLQGVVAARACRHDAHWGGADGGQRVATGLRLAQRERRELRHCGHQPAPAPLLRLVLGPRDGVRAQRQDEDHAPAEVPRHHPWPPVPLELRARSLRQARTARLQWRGPLHGPQIHAPQQGARRVVPLLCSGQPGVLRVQRLPQLPARARHSRGSLHCGALLRCEHVHRLRCQRLRPHFGRGGHEEGDLRARPHSVRVRHDLGFHRQLHAQRGRQARRRLRRPQEVRP
mmetsp:Transcript_63374/g.163045  ORF Transcript_63374/g.163045 Transcript_63374/m.163045 type:complete len:239 (+) Transcript_63374:28-744(+)